MLSEGCRLRIFSHGWGMSLSEGAVTSCGISVSYTHLHAQRLALFPHGDKEPEQRAFRCGLPVSYTHLFRQGRCASATTACVCTPSPTRKTCRARWLPTPVTRSSPPRSTLLPYTTLFRSLVTAPSNRLMPQPCEKIRKRHPSDLSLIHILHQRYTSNPEIVMKNRVLSVHF